MSQTVTTANNNRRAPRNYTRPGETPRTPSSEGNIASEKLDTGNKKFFIDLRENARGRYVRFTEQVGTNRDTIVIPADALPQIIDLLSSVAAFNTRLG